MKQDAQYQEMRQERGIYGLSRFFTDVMTTRLQFNLMDHFLQNPKRRV